MVGAGCWMIDTCSWVRKYLRHAQVLGVILESDLFDSPLEGIGVNLRRIASNFKTFIRDTHSDSHHPFRPTLRHSREGGNPVGVGAGLDSG
jgi:hypothetical protein